MCKKVFVNKSYKTKTKRAGGARGKGKKKRRMGKKTERETVVVGPKKRGKLYKIHNNVWQ